MAVTNISSDLEVMAMTISKQISSQEENRTKIATNTAASLKGLLNERNVPKERGAVLRMIAENFDLIAESGNDRVVDKIIQRVPNADQLVEAMGLKRMLTLWQKGTGKDLKDMAFNLVNSKVFEENH